MYTSTFIKLVEDQYMNLLRESIDLRETRRFRKGELPDFICSRVQKFRNWLNYLVRTTELNADGLSLNSGDFLVYSANRKTLTEPYKPLHPKLISALSVFAREDFDSIFGKAKRELYERTTGIDLSCCNFRICYEHCQLVRNGIVNRVEGSSEGAPCSTILQEMGVLQEQIDSSGLRTRFTKPSKKDERKESSYTSLYQ